MTKKYPSKVSYGLLGFIFVVFFAPLVLDVINEGFQAKTVGILIPLLLIFGLVVHLFLKTEYSIDENVLKIKCGFFSYEPIKINEIKEITLSSTLMSSPAPSFDRIEIKYGKFDAIVLSPKAKFEFVTHLTQINPNIENHLSQK
jgi:hypothetical protein